MPSRTIHLYRSKKKDKKWSVYVDPPGKTIHFGAAGMSDYTKHKDSARMKRYSKRHARNEKWGCSGITTAGFWSKNLLWNKPSLSASAKDIERRCGVKIVRKSPPKFGFSSPKPTNQALYNRIKSEMKRKYVWPSAYASANLVREYKKRGGKYSGSRNNSTSRRNSRSRNNSTSRRSSNQGLSRWFREKWVDACSPSLKPCGRRSVKSGKYPYCRPSVRVSPQTPRTIREISKDELRRRCSRKRSNPRRRVS